MTVQAQGVNPWQTHSFNGGLKQFVSETISSLEGAPSLAARHINIIMRYLFPKPSGWIAEWSGLHGYDVIRDAVVKAKTPLKRDAVELVVEYLRKSDIFGRADLEKEAAKGCVRVYRSGGFVGYARPEPEKYNPEKSLPLEIDQEMQTDLSRHFDAETLSPFPTMRKVTEFYSLYWCPANMTGQKAANIGRDWAGASWGMQFHEGSEKNEVLQEYRNKPAQGDCWIQFPHDVFWRGMTVREQQMLLPASFEIPRFTDAVFCVFMNHLRTSQWTISDSPTTYTRLQEEFQGKKVVVGNAGIGGLHVFCGNHSSSHIGVAAARKF